MLIVSAVTTHHHFLLFSHTTYRYTIRDFVHTLPPLDYVSVYSTSKPMVWRSLVSLYLSSFLSFSSYLLSLGSLLVVSKFTAVPFSF